MTPTTDLKEKYISVLEFAVRAKMATNTAYKLIRQGTVKSIEKRRGTKTSKYIPESELKKYPVE